MEKVGKGAGIGVIEKPKKRVKKIKPPKNMQSFYIMMIILQWNL